MALQSIKQFKAFASWKSPMTSVQITSQVNIGLDQLLSSIAELETPALEQFVGEVNSLLAQRKAPTSPRREIELLEQINQGLPEETQQRYDTLQIKLQDEVITPEEHQELLSLIETVEAATVERLEALVELSNLRDVALDVVMEQLGLQPSAVYA
jgi:hypothetical protein